MVRVVFLCLLVAAQGLQVDRRRALTGFLAKAATVGAPVVALADTAIPPVPLDPFNSLCFGFGCNAAQNLAAGEAAAPTDEASIDFQQFLAYLDAKKVSRVEFKDVRMDAAWAFVAMDEGKPETRIRIGAGYPIDAGDSWNSPLFLTRILNNRNTPYSFLDGLKRRS